MLIESGKIRYSSIEQFLNAALPITDRFEGILWAGKWKVHSVKHPFNWLLGSYAIFNDKMKGAIMVHNGAFTLHEGG